MLLQTLQGEGPAGLQLPLDQNTLLQPHTALILTPASPAAAAPAAAASPFLPAAVAAVAGGIPPADAPAAVAAAMAAYDEDDDDEEFQLDPLDWLLDDERDAEEEERLAQLVQVHPMTAGRGTGSSRTSRSGETAVSVGVSLEVTMLVCRL